MKTSKRPWTRGEKLMLLTPVVIAAGTGAFYFTPQEARRQTGTPQALGTPPVLNLPEVARRLIGAPQTLATSPALSLRALRISGEDRLLAATGADDTRTNPSPEGTIYLWNAQTLKPLPPIPPPPSLLINRPGIRSTVYGLAVTPDGSALAVSRLWFKSGERQFALLDLKTRRPRWTSSLWAEQADFSPDGRRLALSGDGKVSVLDAKTGKLVKAWDTPKSYERLVRWSPDSRTLASITEMKGEDSKGHVGHGVRVALHEIDTSKTRKLGSNFTKAFNFSSDGQRLITVGEELTPGKDIIGSAAKAVFVRCFDVASGNLLWGKTSTPNTKPLEQYRDAVFSPDGRIIAVHAVGNSQILLLDAQDGHEVQHLRLQQAQDTTMGYPHSLVFAADGKRLFVRGKSTVFVFDLHS